MKLVLGSIALAFVLAGCPCGKETKLPTGPSPEYEDPPAPSWAKEAGAASPAPAPVPGALEEPPPVMTPAAPDAG